MIETRFFIRCDGDGCERTWPTHNGAPAVVDAAIHTHAEIRAEAALFHNWDRIGGRDYCDRCAFVYSRERKGGKR